MEERTRKRSLFYICLSSQVRGLWDAYTIVVAKEEYGTRTRMEGLTGRKGMSDFEEDGSVIICRRIIVSSVLVL